MPVWGQRCSMRLDPNDVWTEISLGNRIARYYAEQALGRRLRFGEIDAWFAEIAIDYIRDHPREFLARSFRRFCFVVNARFRVVIVVLMVPPATRPHRNR